MELTKEDKVALLITKKLKENPIHCCKVENYGGFDWEVIGDLIVGEIGHFEISFTIDCCEKNLGFNPGWDAQFKFRDQKAHNLKFLAKFIGDIEKKLQPFIDFLVEIEKEIKH